MRYALHGELQFFSPVFVAASVTFVTRDDFLAPKVTEHQMCGAANRLYARDKDGRK
jgi:hypothetical protein